MSTPLYYRLERITSADSRLIIGLMSGTSADSIDAALCKISGGGFKSGNSPGTSIKLIGHCSRRYTAKTQTKIQSAATLSVAELSELDLEIGAEFGAAALELIKETGLAPSDISLIGSHGQTVYHHSGQRKIKATRQLGDGDQIAAITGVITYSDFRVKDIVMGGEGAPLTPYADRVLFQGRQDTIDKAVINLGGIANITVLSADPYSTIGFDIGPANAPLDRIAVKLTQGKVRFDRDGALARKGRVNVKLLDELLSTDTFITKTPPRSTGFEEYGDSFVDRAIARHGACDNDLLATIVEFVARCIKQAIDQFVVPKNSVNEVILAGGGSANKFLVERIGAVIAPVKVSISDQYGVPAEFREAMAFAALANDSLLGICNSLPSVTGARAPAILGKLSVP